MIRGLHHSAYRCRDSEETRRFYEDFLGLRLAVAHRLTESKTGRTVHALHTFFALDDGSFLAFFEVPEQPFEFKEQHDFDLHIALEVSDDALAPMLERARRAGVPTRGITEHDFIRSVYFRDPNGYVIELTPRGYAAAGVVREAVEENGRMWERGVKQVLERYARLEREREAVEGRNVQLGQENRLMRGQMVQLEAELKSARARCDQLEREKLQPVFVRNTHTPTPSLTFEQPALDQPLKTEGDHLRTRRA